MGAYRGTWVYIIGVHGRLQGYMGVYTGVHRRL